MKSGLTIWAAGNKTMTLYFEDKDDAEEFASDAGITSGVTVWPVSVVPKSK